MLKFIGTFAIAVGLSSGVHAGTNPCENQAQICNHLLVELDNNTIPQSKVTSILRACTEVYQTSLTDLEAAYVRDLLTITEINKSGVIYYDVWYVSSPGIICLNDSDL